MGQWGVDFQGPSALAKRVSAMLSAPDAFEVVAEESAKTAAHVRIRSRAAATTGDLLPRAEARIDMTGSLFILRLDGILTLDEIYDHDDDGVLQILSDFCAMAQDYLGGAGTIMSRPARRGADHVSVVLTAGDDQYLLEGRLPSIKRSPHR